MQAKFLAVSGGADRRARGGRKGILAVASWLAFGLVSLLLPLSAMAAGNSVVVSTPNPILGDGQTAVLRFQLEQPALGFESSDIEAVGGTVVAFSYGPLFDYASAAFIPDPGFQGVAQIRVPAGSFSFPATGGMNAASNVQFITVDTVAPSLTVSVDRAVVNSLVPAQLTFTFSEPVVGFSAANVVLSGGTLVSFSPLFGGAAYTASYVPDAGFEGAGGVSVAPGSFADAAGNVSYSVSSVSFAVDARAPDFSITSPPGGAVYGVPTALQITFSEPVQNFDLQKISSPGGCFCQSFRGRCKLHG